MTDNVAKPGYHIHHIPKGVYGEFSKVEEEMHEVIDAWGQNSSIMAIVELTDMLGAMEAYYGDKFTVCLINTEDLMTNGKFDGPGSSESFLISNFTNLTLDPDNMNLVSRLLAAIIMYLNEYNLYIGEAQIMNHITKRAFINGRRS